MPRDPNLELVRRTKRSRSRSPYRAETRKHRDRSPRRQHKSHSPHDDSHKKHRHHRRSDEAAPVSLPYGARELSKRHFEEYKPLFQSYLDIQKQINMDELDEREVKGRWKSFVGRWNRGDLARSWYDPAMLKTAQDTVKALQNESPKRQRRASPDYGPRKNTEPTQSDDEDDFGPAPPPSGLTRHSGHGPTVPRLDDLTYRDELRREDRERDQSNYRDDIRYERKLVRKAQKDRLEELVPRADPGSRERQLEKKRETTNTLKDFREAKENGDVEVGEADLMGDDGIDEYKKKKRAEERQKTERELRREEIHQARAAERAEKAAERRAKEAQTMNYLKALARERFGPQS